MGILNRHSPLYSLHFQLEYQHRFSQPVTLNYFCIDETMGEASGSFLPHSGFFNT